MNTVERMLDATREIWERCAASDLVRGLEDGTLPKEKFRYYILQDYLYLLDYTRVFAVGLAKAQSVQTMRLFAGSIQAIAQGEMDIHNGYMGKFGISQQEVDATEPAMENRSYTAYMLRVAWEGDEIETLAAVLSCALSYEWIAKGIVARNPKSIEHPFYGDWLREYTSESYAQENRNLTAVMNALTQDLPEARVKRLVDIFKVCSRYELAFWEMGWRGPQAGEQA